VDGFKQGNRIPELVIVEEHPDFGKEELNVESGSIFLCVVSQDNLSSY
jgi:hypothetical protein